MGFPWILVLVFGYWIVIRFVDQRHARFLAQKTTDGQFKRLNERVLKLERENEVLRDIVIDSDDRRADFDRRLLAAQEAKRRKALPATTETPPETSSSEEAAK